jgi:outer membrane lipoprotein
MLLRFNLLVILFLLLSGCASGPIFDSGGVDRSLIPRGVIADPQIAKGKQVLWGGSIIRTTNLKDSTQMEVLAYPLDANERPQSESDPLGRFILEQSGYLEPKSYAVGRLVTVVGAVSGSRVGRVGESEYDFPVVGARQIHLWPEDKGRGVSFGVGVGTWF